MTNKEFTAELSRRLGYTTRDTSMMVMALLSAMVQQWQDGNVISIPDFGTFEVEKKMEHVVVHPDTKLRWLVPPKLELTYRPCASLEEKCK